MSDTPNIVHLVIDDKPVDVEEGTTILQAAAKLGITIPIMCYKEGFKPSTSCMVCVVQLERNSSLVPSCGALAQDGMRVRTNTPDVVNARKIALELLLSEHAGDCEGPCKMGCPAKMNIPLMLRRIASGRLDLAIAAIKEDIALPAVLGRICPAPCEKVCRRKGHDSAVSICQLKKFVADNDLARSDSYQPQCEPNVGKQAAIVGAGPCGLAAAYYMARAGIRCVLFDKNEKAGGMLRKEIPAEVLPRDILDREISTIFAMENVEFRGGVEIGTAVSFESLCTDYDAVFVAMGEKITNEFGLEKAPKGLKADLQTYKTGREKVFAGGGAIGRPRFCVRAVADGKEAAASILRYLFGRDIVVQQKRFYNRLGQLMEGEMEQFLVGVEAGPRCQPSKEGFSTQEATVEAKRCLQCDCAMKDTCALRELAGANQARQQTYVGQRKSFFRRKSFKLGLVFEPGKCILCGLCVETAKHYNGTGLAFAGRGFKTQVNVPLNKVLDDALTKEAAEKCIEICPTGALSKM